MSIWPIYTGTGNCHDNIKELPDSPNWRKFSGKPIEIENIASEKNPNYITSGEEEVTLVNAALFLRRPLLVTGKPGCGKSTLARAVAHELKLGQVLYWSITSHSTLQEGLYAYDAVGRLQETHLWEKEGKEGTPDIGKYIHLGPLGTALLPTNKPRVLLIDEIDKSDLDLPNDLLHVFERGEFEIPELSRLEDVRPEIEIRTHDGLKANISRGRIVCHQFPFIILTSNREKEFPPPFLRRCIRLEIPQPSYQKLTEIVRAHMGDELTKDQLNLVELFRSKRDGENLELATDQLLNAIYILTAAKDIKRERDGLLKSLLRSLNE